MNTSKKFGATFSLCAGYALALWAAGVCAQSDLSSAPQAKQRYQIPDDPSQEPKEEVFGQPKGLLLGSGIRLFPYFGLQLGHDDNLFLKPTAKLSTNVTVANPGLALEVKSPSSKLLLGLDFKLGRYAESSADAYNDIAATVQSDFIASSRLGFKFNGGYTRTHDARGTTDRGESIEPDRSHTPLFNALVAYGGNEAAGRFELEAGLQHKVYENNRATTELSDRRGRNLAGRVFLRVAPKTYGVFEFRDEVFDYDLAASTQDSGERRYLAGLTWEATAATSGYAKVGHLQKKFDSSSRSNFSAPAWEVGVKWSPTVYSFVDMYTLKTVAESTGLGDLISGRKYGAKWAHSWSEIAKSSISLARAEDDFSGAGANRKDRTNSLAIRFDYRLLRWLTVSGELNRADRSSNDSLFDYKRNTVFFSALAAL